MASRNEKDDILSSAIGRFFKVSGIAAKMGTALAKDTIAGIFLDEEKKQERRSEFWEAGGELLAESMGRMKGGIMKVGQMLSIQEGLLPPEFTTVLKSLQKDAVPLKFSAMKKVFYEEIPDAHEIFERVEENALASASVGQVHRALLKDGREVVVKIQYPNMRKIIESDLKNLKVIIKMIFSMLGDLDFDSIWKEISTQLMFELDYEREARNQKLYADWAKRMKMKWLVVPEVIEEASTARVLCTKYEPGLTLEEIQGMDDGFRDQIGEKFFILFLSQMYHFDRLHADPNAANYSIREDGNIVLYDFGQVKEIPEDIREGYRSVTRLARNETPEKIPEALESIGVRYAENKPLDESLVMKYYNTFQPLIQEGEYRFGPEDHLLKGLVELNSEHWRESMKIEFPSDMIFIDRTMAGLVGNLCTLRAKINWRKLVDEWALT